MTRTLLSVPAISCDHCKRAVTEALAGVEGVRAVDVDVPAKTVLVTYDEDVVSLNRLEEVLAEEDYPVAATRPA